MQYITPEATDLRVSRLCLGCMTFGEPDRGKHAWTLPEESSRPLIQRALEGGINFFDTANSYSKAAAKRSLAAPCATLPAATKWWSPPRFTTRWAICRKASPGRKSCALSTTACGAWEWSMLTCCNPPLGLHHADRRDPRSVERGG
ncbi:Predicted oxidoreductase [Raoultella terrigena]|uniref:Predicted oxidoreductase n=1 Tax=Raoultella terrigena TaxID=577 RepID=A0A4U9D754_RAOTE|nr:Predicted oxidoreductase [Raoultella terrigena]